MKELNLGKKTIMVELYSQKKIIVLIHEYYIAVFNLKENFQKI